MEALIYKVYPYFSAPFRGRRMKRFLDLFNPSSGTTILDVGGYPLTWKGIKSKPSVTVLNIHPIDYALGPDDPPISTVIGNGCSLDFPDKSFDIIFCNSVIEHVSTWERQQELARECRRVGKSLWIQTPARSFFIEPHLLTPFIHYLPRNLQRRLMRNFTLWGLLSRPTPERVDELMAEIRLLNRREMACLFPDCDLTKERVLGLVKSYIAVRKVV